MQRPDWGTADYQILAELATGPLGRIRLASIVRGRDAGRLVRLRSVPFDLASVLARSVEVGSRIAHARLLKVLGLAVVDGELNVASEFVEGVSLWELSRAAREQRRPVTHAVALRIVSDLLEASVAARSAFRSVSGVELGRCIWPDTAWIAAFGEALLTEPGVGATLALGVSAADPYLTPEESHGEAGGAASDVFAAGVLLWELFANRALFGSGDPERVVERVRSEPIARLGATGNFGDPVPAEVARIVESALCRDLAERYSRPEGMVAAIAALPRELVASDDEVQSALEELVHIEQQRKTATSFLPASGNHEVLWDIPTRSLRVPRELLDDDRVTLRPSARTLAASGAPATEATEERATLTAPEPGGGAQPASTLPRRSRGRLALVLALLALALGVAAYAASRARGRGALPSVTAEPRLDQAAARSGVVHAATRSAAPARVEHEPSSAAPGGSADAPRPHASGSGPARPQPGYRPRSIGPYRPKGI